MQSPVLFLVFNRPDTTQRVFDAIKLAQPPRLYIAADGPRDDKANDKSLCEEVRNIVTKIDWPCEVKTLFREHNLGCKIAVSSAINWLFEQEEQGIILEDDCLPNESFFRFCDELLVRYKDDERIMHISGLQPSPELSHQEYFSYYFSKCVLIWGWATWRRAWQKYSLDIKTTDLFSERKQLSSAYQKNWQSIVHINNVNAYVKENMNTWDIPWAHAVLKNDGIAIQPNYNLIRNIGFGNNATHTSSEPAFVRHLQQQEMSTLVHPHKITVDKGKDLKLLKALFPLRNRSLSVFAYWYKKFLK